MYACCCCSSAVCACVQNLPASLGSGDVVVAAAVPSQLASVGVYDAIEEPSTWAANDRKAVPLSTWLPCIQASSPLKDAAKLSPNAFTDGETYLSGVLDAKWRSLPGGSQVLPAEKQWPAAGRNPRNVANAMLVAKAIKRRACQML